MTTPPTQTQLELDAFPRESKLPDTPDPAATLHRRAQRSIRCRETRHTPRIHHKPNGSITRINLRKGTYTLAELLYTLLLIYNPSATDANDDPLHQHTRFDPGSRIHITIQT